MCNIYEGKKLLLTKEKMDKEKYKEIKNYSREEMNNFLYNVYVLAMEDTFKEIADQQLFSRKEFEETFTNRIKSIKGIGKDKKKIIQDLITQIFEDMREIKIETNIAES